MTTHTTSRPLFARVRRYFHRLARADSGAVMIEFALGLPIMVTIGLTGAELTNFVTTKMRISQQALQIADNASRIGTGTILSTKQISEAQINDLLTGAGLQAGNLDLFEHGRVIVSSLQADTLNTGKYTIKWQRCRGVKSTTSGYGLQGANNLTGITANGQLITAPANGAVIFVQISYSYQPLLGLTYAKSTEINEIAAMTVRDSRDLTTIYNTEAVTASTCNLFTAT